MEKKRSFSSSITPGPQMNIEDRTRISQKWVVMYFILILCRSLVSGGP